MRGVDESRGDEAVRPDALHGPEDPDPTGSPDTAALSAIEALREGDPPPPVDARPAARAEGSP